MYTVVLTKWLEAASTFYNHYNQLRPYATLVSSGQDLSAAKFVNQSQCPAGQLRRLLGRMHQELEMLVQDMDQAETPDSGCTQQQCRKLTTHTRILTQLNQRAQTMSLLITLPAS
ncbi:hypothetical protein SD10_15275 [Spirosoma radiotolerans]|uniref:Uncharacterized protein n=2 Tax=Spirosoma radiotolerans TaxID=1379870 RepID=A0A0E3ZX04_9BACT|nr:hypothetical protein SD10_15275 [Spirosoma radiotolerans]